MRRLADYHYREVAGDLSRPPLVLLHGSGATEEDWADFGDVVAPGAAIYNVRGPIAWEDGFAFFRRNPDRSLDYDDLSIQTINLARFLGALSERHAFRRPPVLAGYSNGAIITASLIARQHALTSGAVLLRPLSPFRDIIPVMTKGYPLLILAARHDSRRDPRDHEIVAARFISGGADVTHRLQDCDHGMDDQDLIETKEWLQSKFL
ncbi:MAG: hypothetical protein JWM58_3415 [Rhizobium sp.]|nr:hypothetical protein [Rhizobium sp.]